MYFFSKKLVCLVVVLSLLIVPFGSLYASGFEDEDKEIKAGKMAADAIIVRPLGLVATVVGGALFIVSLPFSALGGNTGEAFDAMLAHPAKYTFTRPLGDF